MRGNLSRRMQTIEKRVMRIVVCALLVLTVVQIGRARDPLEFYLAVAKKVESAAMETDLAYPVAAGAQDPAQTAPVLGTLTLRAQPAADVRIWQHDKLLGTLRQGDVTVQVQAGPVLLDGRSLAGVVNVQVIRISGAVMQPTLYQNLMIQGNIQTLLVTP
ncbi:MAG: hypothetical protein LBT32_05560 [Peptococcaceae bacterium]|nr:hypothetical protein [Peptococcaceae bacterium]